MDLKSDKIKRGLQGVYSCFVPRFKILAYHSVNKVSRDPYELDADNFLWQMQYLAKKKYNVISLEDAYGLLIRKQPIPKKTVVITFDDGFLSLTQYAFPILKKYNFPATVFLPLDFIGGIDTFSYSYPRPDMKILGWDAIENSKNFGIAYGSHTMSHQNLIELDPLALEAELRNSKKVISDRLNPSFFPFAYPFGMFNEREKVIVKAVGYDCALCFGNIMSNTTFTDLLELRREKILAIISKQKFHKKINPTYDFSRKILDMIRRLK